MHRSNRSSGSYRLLLIAGFGFAGVMSVSPLQAQELCGGVDYPFPYTDVSGVGAAFCPGIMEAYVTGVSKGTTPTTFSPNENVTRVQMTTFLQRSLDQALTRNGRRAAAEQWWLPKNSFDMQFVQVGVANSALLCKPDRDSIWVAVSNDNTVVRVDASTGTVLGTWTGATNAFGVLVAAGYVFVTGNSSPGVIYVIDPTTAPGPVTPLPTAAAIGNFPRGIAFDGANIWTANGDGTISIITLEVGLSSPVSTIHNGAFVQPFGMVFDGSLMWATDLLANKLFQFDGSGNILKTVSTGGGPAFPVFDGANIWVPDANSSEVTVVQASTGAIVATFTGAEINQPATAAFDGARILVTNQSGQSAALFKAADLSLIGTIPLNYNVSAYPYGACSDGLNFWVTDYGDGFLLRI